MSTENAEATAPASSPDNGDGIDLRSYLDVSYAVEICVGRTVKTLGDILTLEPGDTITLDRPAHETVVLTIEDRPIAKAEVVLSEKGSSIQIAEIWVDE